MTTEENIYKSESTDYASVQFCYSARMMIAFLGLSLIISVALFIYFMYIRHRNRQFRAKLKGMPQYKSPWYIKISINAFLLFQLTF